MTFSPIDPREGPGRIRRAARAAVRFLAWLVTPRQLLSTERRGSRGPTDDKQPPPREDR
jgi:hypothetical protein